MPKNALLSRVLRQNQQKCAFCPHFSGRPGLPWDLGTDLPRILRAFRTLCPVFYVFSQNLSRILRGIPHTLAKYTQKMSLEAPFEHSGGLLPNVAKIRRPLVEVLCYELLGVPSGEPRMLDKSLIAIGAKSPG